MSTAGATWQEILAARQPTRETGILAPATVFGKSAIWSHGIHKGITFDSAEMSVSAIISTPTEDRSKDVVIPTGIVLDNYKINPVVFYDHGFSGITLPIATSRSPDGEIAVCGRSEYVEAKSWFSKSLKEARQIFDLIVEGIVNSTSINLQPIDAEVRKQEPESGYGRPGLLIKTWELLEWSWVGLPDNPEARAKWIEKIARVLDVGKLDGSPIAEPILKFLTPYYPLPKAHGKGIDPMPDPVAKTLEEMLKDPANLAKAKAIVKAADDTPAPTDAGKDDDDDDDGSDNDSDEDEDDDEEIENSPSHKHLTKCYKMLNSAAGQMTKMAAVNEHPVAKGHLQGQVETLEGMAGETAKCYQKCFSKEMAKDDDEGGGDSMEKWFAESKANGLRAVGLVENIKSCLSAKNLTKQRASLQAYVKSLERLAFEAIEKHGKKTAPVDDADTIAAKARLKSLNDQSAEAEKKLAEMIPAGK